MTIKLQELLKEAGLSDDQKALLEAAQKTVDSTLNSEIETAKNGLLNKNQELIDKLKTAKENSLPDGFDMEGYNSYIEDKDKILEDKRKAEEDKLIASQNWDKLKNDMTNSHENSLTELASNKDKEINLLRSTLDTMLIENVALKEIEKVEGSQVLLMPHIKNNIKTFQDESGKYGTKVVDATGQDRMNAETGNPMKVSELVAEFQANESFAGAFPIQNGGSNTKVKVPGGNYNSTNNPFDKKGKHYSLTEQAKLRKTNPELAKTLQEATG